MNAWDFRHLKISFSKMWIGLIYFVSFSQPLIIYFEFNPPIYPTYLLGTLKKRLQFYGAIYCPPIIFIIFIQYFWFPPPIEFFESMRINSPYRSIIHNHYQALKANRWPIIWFPIYHPESQLFLIDPRDSLFEDPFWAWRIVLASTQCWHLLWVPCWRHLE